MTGDVLPGSARPSRHQLAYQACAAEMLSLPKEQVQAVNLNVMDAVRTVMAVRERLGGLRSAVASSLSEFDLTLWDKLETYTLALQQAHSDWAAASKTPDVPRELIAHAKQQFELLLAVAQALASRGLFDQWTLKKAKMHRGRLRYAYGLLLLVEELRQAWPRVADKTGLTVDELLKAELAGERLASGVAKKNAPVERGQQLAQMRDRAFTLFIYAYGQVRRAVQYLRWDHDDAGVFAPSLYRRRHVRRVKARVKLDARSVPVEQPGVPAPNRQEENAIEPAALPAPSVPAVEHREVQPTQAAVQSLPVRDDCRGADRLEPTKNTKRAPDGVARARAAHRKRMLGKRRSQRKVARFRWYMHEASDRNAAQRLPAPTYDLGSPYR